MLPQTPQVSASNEMVEGSPVQTTSIGTLLMTLSEPIILELLSPGQGRVDPVTAYYMWGQKQLS